MNTNNGKLYLFAIGGTGARVLKSLIMLLASGTKINAKEIIPVIIDLDKNNGSLGETLEILTLYKEIQKQTNSNSTEYDQGFFKTKVSLPEGLTSHALNLHVTRDGSDAQHETLKDFVAYDTMSSSNTKYLVDLLYSKQNLEDSLSIGFKGQPHIGAITFYNITQIQGFVTICQEIETNDRIFFISSIFGGTGSSGFPTLLKILRDQNNGLPNQRIRASVKVGSLIVLPYFSLEEKVNGEYIDSNVFMTKTKLALSFYDDHLDGYDAMYYICEPNQNRRFNNELGSLNQQNGAHFIEMLGALSVINFTYVSDNEMANPIYFEFATMEQGNKSSLTFADLAENEEEGQPKIKRELTRFLYLYKYFHPSSGKNNYENQEWAKLHFSKFFDGNGFYPDTFKRFLVFYYEWLIQMEKGDYRFSPFNLDVGDNGIGEMIKGIKIGRRGGVFGLGTLPAIHFRFLDTKLGDKVTQTVKDKKPEHFFRLFFESINQLFDEEQILKS